ncbi:MAG TPA: septum formation protein Maf [Aquificaceae bacterium]|nr:septum formation protein Maf [Aquificaceae bacterium]HIQ48100.1 septum formation protein Maf [Aquifex aeolicus]
MKIILASSSPRRIEILSLLRLKFEIIPAKIREEKIEGKPILTARKLAKEKALAVWKQNRDSVVIGADTLVFLGKEIIGKPGSEEEAFAILRKLSGRWHKVVTAVAILTPFRKVVLHDVAKVKFRNLNDEEIMNYIKTGEPMDKAGAYGVQGFGATIVEKIHGSFYTVMGLPIVKVYEILREYNLITHPVDISF